MTDSKKNSYAFLRWIWANISAGVALALIVLALIIGYRIGRPAGTEVVDAVSLETDGEEHADGESVQMYTCSMHPFVRKSNPNDKCPICGMDLIPVVESGGADVNAMRMSLSESAKVMSQIETAKVGRFFPSAEVRLYGKLVYDETSVARLSAYFPGRVDRLFVNYVGVSVAQGDHLASMYSPDLLAAFEELRQARKSVDDSRDVSDFVRETAMQTLVASREKLRLFGLEADQIADVESGKFDSDQLTVYAPIGGVVTHLAAREGDYLKTGDPIATVSDLSRLWLDLEAYESQLPLLRWGMPVTFTVESHPGEVFEGRISFIEPIVDDRTRTAAVRVAVDNADGRLKPGMFATAVAHPKIGADGAVLSNELAGRWVGSMHPTIVRNGPGECPICGMDLVTAESLGVVGDPTAVQVPLVIPRTAVLYTGTRSVVYVQVPDTDQPTYEGRVIQLGSRAGDFYTVRSGVEEGEEVVVHGAFRIDSAMQIVAKPSMMSPGGGGAPSMPGMDMGTKMPGMDMSSSLPPDAFIESLDPIYLAYLDAQESLAQDNLSGFLESVQVLNGAIDSVEVLGLVGESLGSWRAAAAGLKLEEAITTIDDARDRFEKMSMSLIDLQNKFGHQGDETWHVAYCPMKKAKWIQRGTDINNPYYGDAMLECGDIQQDLEPIGGKSTEMSPEEMKSMDSEEGHEHD
jgi:membrane fusion protein, copper/silver efflux system